MCPLILQLKESLKGIIDNLQSNKAYKRRRIPANYWYPIIKSQLLIKHANDKYIISNSPIFLNYFEKNNFSLSLFLKKESLYTIASSY